MERKIKIESGKGTRKNELKVEKRINMKVGKEDKYESGKGNAKNDSKVDRRINTKVGWDHQNSLRCDIFHQFCLSI